VTAIVLSFLAGLLGGAGILYIVMRALVFGIIFFGLGAGIRVFINSFFPEILSVMSDDEESDTLARPGSRVNITLDNNRGFALPEMYRNPDKPDEIGNIADLLSGSLEPVTHKADTSRAGIDQNREDVYTNGVFDISDVQNTKTGKNSQADNLDSDISGNKSRAAPVFTPSFGNDDKGLGGLPDLDALAGAFLGSDEGTAPLPSVEPGGPARSPLGNKAQPLKGDFNPKELAEGLRTILIKEKQ